MARVDLSSALSVVVDALFRHWATKIAAVVLAAVVFVSARDEVTRAFEIPLRVVPDPQRVLTTPLPSAIQVQVRGPWTRVNRLQDYDFGAATVRLKDTKGGPLKIDPADIVMPSGVVLAGIQYEPVDLRFESVVSREIPVTPDLVGTPASDYRVARVDVEPPRLSITGGQSQVQKVRQLVTEPLDIGGADATVERQLAVLRPDAEVTFTGTNRGEFPRVKVSVGLEPMVSKRGVEVPIFDAAQWGGAVASSYSVELGGPAPTLRHLDQLGLAEPVAAQVKEIRDPDAPSQKAVEIRFGWTSAVPPDVREGLSIVPSAVRVPLPSAAAKSPEPLPR